MDTKIMVVGSVKCSLKGRRPRIRLAGFWLNEFGFEYNSLASAEYEPGQIIIKLEGSGIDTYNRVVKKVLANKGGLLHVRLYQHGKQKDPHLDISGLWLKNFGFNIGSIMAVKLEYGLITIRLVDFDKL